MTKQETQERRAGGSLRRWHARLGLAAGVFFALLVISGILLNHTETLELDSTPVRSPLVLKWYGLETVVPDMGFPVGERYLVATQDRWVLSDQLLAQGQPAPIGALELNGLVYVATRSGLYLYDTNGVMIDRVDQTGLPAVPLLRLGALGREVVIATDQGRFSSEDGLNWQPARSEPGWCQLVPLSEATRYKLHDMFAANVPLERLLLDLHSGRLFGQYGPVVIDLAAVCLAVLALSGVSLYGLARRRRRSARD